MYMRDMIVVGVEHRPAGCAISVENLPMYDIRNSETKWEQGYVLSSICLFAPAPAPAPEPCILERINVRRKPRSSVMGADFDYVSLSETRHIWLDLSEIQIIILLHADTKRQVGTKE